MTSASCLPAARITTKLSIAGLDRRSLEELEEPSGPHNVASQGLSPPAELTIRCDECDLLISCVRDDLHEHVVTAAAGVENRDAAGEATLCALASLAFHDHDDGLGNLS